MIGGFFLYLFKQNFYQYFNELAISILNFKSCKAMHKSNSQSVNNLGICVKLTLKL